MTTTDATDKRLFVCGVDTDCGKTFITGQIAAELQRRGLNVITQKPVQTGCDNIAEDLKSHRNAMGMGLTCDDMNGRTCSYLFHKPASPHLSARLEGVVIDPAKIDEDTQYLCSRYDRVLIEAAGGLMVPLNEQTLTIDFAARRQMPMLLVATSKLGGINHALLSVEACLHHGCDLRVLIFNRMPDFDPVMADDALDIITAHARKIFPNIQIVDFTGPESLSNVDI